MFLFPRVYIYIYIHLIREGHPDLLVAYDDSQYYRVWFKLVRPIRGQQDRRSSRCSPFSLSGRTSPTPRQAGQILLENLLFLLIGSYGFVLVWSLLFSPCVWTFSRFLSSVSFPCLVGRHLRFRRFATVFLLYFFRSLLLYFLTLFSLLSCCRYIPHLKYCSRFFVFLIILQLYGLRLYIHDFGRFNRGRHYMDIPPSLHFPSCLDFSKWFCLF